MDFEKYIDKDLKPTVKLRQCIERRIVDEIAKELFNRGFVVKVYDGEDFVTKRTSDPELVQQKIMRTDEDALVVFVADDKTKEPCGWIHFVYGNDGFDVVSNYTTNMEAVVDPIVAKYS